MNEIFELVRKHRCSIEIRYVEKGPCYLIRIEKNKYVLTRQILLDTAIYWPEDTRLFRSIVHEMIRIIEEHFEETEDKE